MAPSEGSGRSAIKSLGLTVALALVPLLGARIPLPGVDSGAEWLRGAAGRSLSVLALGILPVLNGYFWVELAALVVPRWRWLRHDFPGGRAKLERAAGVLGLLLTAFQAFGLALMYEGVGEHGQGADVSRSLFVITLLGTTSVLLLLARVIDRLGLVCGALALQVALDLDSVVFYLQKRPLWASPLHAVFIVGLYAAPFVLTWAALRGWAPRRESGRLWLPVPASSLHPLGASLSAVGLPVALTSTMPFLPGLDAWSRAAERHGFELRIVAAMAMALVVIWLLQVPDRVAARLSRASQARVDAQAVSRAALGPLLPTLVFIAALVVTEELLSVNALPSAVGTSALSTALLLDGWGALKARRRANELVCIWQERRPYLVPPVLAAAADDGITLHALGVGQASLLRIFGPYASVGLWCERADVPRALPLVAARLAEPPGAEPESSEERAPNPAKPTFGGGRHAVPFLTVTALITLLASTHYSAESGLRSFGGGPVNPRASFEVLEVDDEHDPLGELQGASLPPSAALYQEDLRRGDPDGRRHFLRVTLRENETLSDALRPISPVLKALPRTPDARWIWERLRDEAGGAAPASGPTYRSYLVRSEPRFTTRDLSSVELVGGDNGASWSTLRLDAEAAAQLRLFSREHLGERMVIALDDEVVSVPMLTTELKGGVLTIQHGWGTPEEQHAAAADFVQKLTAR